MGSREATSGEQAQIEEGWALPFDPFEVADDFYGYTPRLLQRIREESWLMTTKKTS